MTRTKFIWIYVAGVLVAFYGGAPWSYVFVISSPVEAGETPVHFYLIALIAPAMLVWAAHVRGQSIKRPRLALFPIGAFFLSLVGIIWDRYLSSAPAAQNRGTLEPASALFLLYGPALVHAICFSIGAKLRSSSNLKEATSVSERETQFDSAKEKGEPPVLAMAFVNCVAILPLALVFRLTASRGETIVFCVAVALFIAAFTAAGIAAAKGKYRDSAVAIAGMAWPSFIAAFVAYYYALRLMNGTI